LGSNPPGLVENIVIDYSSVLALLLVVTPHHTDKDEPPNERAARMVLVADAIVTHAQSRREAAAMISSLIHESGLARRVGPTGRGDKGKSAGYWQPQKRTCPGAWVENPVEAINAGAECAARLFRSGFASCGTPLGAFTRYNGSRGCPEATWAKGRVRTFYWAYGKIKEIEE
jgi:hypothetical protein